MKALAEQVNDIDGVNIYGRVVGVRGLMVEIAGPIHAMSVGSRIVIDTCNDGCGVWLDAGEIQALEIFFEQSQRAAADVIPLRWRLWASLQDLFRERKTRPH